MKVDLWSKVALVTGAGQGIGRGIALSLAENKASVAITDLADTVFQVAKEINALGSKALPLKCDVSNKASVEAAFQRALTEFGRIDILVNNAGIYPFKPFLEMSEQDWDTVLDVNLKGVFNCTKVVLPKMIEQTSGRIINISSIAGAVVGYANLVHYSASKSGIVGFTRSLALEVAKHGITVNAISPGAIETPTTKKISEAAAEQMVSAIPIPRWGTPNDIANLVLFLSGEESSYITGQCIIIDGGMTLV